MHLKLVPEYFSKTLQTDALVAGLDEANAAARPAATAERTAAPPPRRRRDAWRPCGGGGEFDSTKGSEQMSTKIESKEVAGEERPLWDATSYLKKKTED